MLEQALVKWKELPRESRLLEQDAATKASDVARPARTYPDGGLVLHVASRDLPRETPEAQERGRWRVNAWNQDYAWFTKDEARKFVPEEPEAGARHEVPAALIRRLSRANLLDNVRGQTWPYREQDVVEARLTAHVVKVEGVKVFIHLEGLSHTSVEGIWPVNDRFDQNRPTDQKRGYRANLMGDAEFDTKTGRFVRFDMLVLGIRWGGTQYNSRARDLDPAPLGHAISLAGSKPAERVAPAHLGRAYDP